MSSNGAQAATDLKTINPEESYVVDGQRIVLKQNPGEVLIKLDPASAQSVTEISTATNGTYAKFRTLDSKSALFSALPPAQPTAESSQSAIDDLNADSRVVYAYPVFVNPGTGKRVFLNDEIVVCFNDPSADVLSAVDPALGLMLADTLSAADRIYVFRLTEPKNFNPFRICQSLLGNGVVAWAEPNVAQDGQALGYPPNDTFLGAEWYVRNTGQTGARSGADVRAFDAWSGGKYGSLGIRIAILDNGVDVDHIDLAANIVAGYDFKDSDADPRPANSFDNHGTAVAGAAAAVVDNNQGVTGIAGKCKILPIRIAKTLDASGALEFPAATTIYRALAYAADNADVINCSWKLGTPSSTVTGGVSYANGSGRGGKGCPVMVAAGNDAAGHGTFSWEGDLLVVDIFDPPPTGAGLGAGTFRVEFSYEKDTVGSAGDDAVWLAEIYVPLSGQTGYSVFTFDNGSFAGTGWTPGGNASWLLDHNDPAHMHGTSQYALRSGVITDNQKSTLQSPLLDITQQKPAVFFRRWMSSENLDVLRVHVKDQSGNDLAVLTFPGGQVTGRGTAVVYPASLSGVSAVGASTDFDYRSHYSPIDATLDFVAPSAGGFASQNSFFGTIHGITTTDRTGAAGYVAGDYTDIFGDTSPVGGTSMSSAIAAGVAGLILSKDGNFTRSSVLSKMNENCDKVGPVAYTGTPPLTRNDYYGYGRLNAFASLNVTTADTSAPSFTLAQTIHYRAVDVTFSEPMGEGAEDPTKYQIIAGQGTLSTSPNKVLRILPTAYRLIWNSGDMAVSGTVTIKVLSGVKDVAGNLLPANVTQDTTGTKRIIGINCGNNSPMGYLDGYEFYYTPPFVSDNGFQGNEAAVYLTSSTPVYTTTFGVDRSFVTDPAPEAVYKCIRPRWNSPSPITYSIPVPSGTYTVRLHFAEIYFAGGDIGYQVFDIKINGVLKYDNFDILAVTGGNSHRAYIYEVPNISPSGGIITVELVPQMGVDEIYRAAINGIEIVKP